jgi:ribonuclease PH
VGGRTHEIQRLVGRALRAVTDLDILGERTFTIDCDVIQADGGTRCAAITGAYVALHRAFEGLLAKSALSNMPLRVDLAAVSVGVVDGVPLLDLTYEEDSRADVDFNVVMTAAGEFVELQGTAESAPFPRAMLDQVLQLAERGIRELMEAQNQALAALHRPDSG